jgi:hypothetical protein
MAEDILWRIGLSVDLVMAPNDIRSASIRKVRDGHITLNQAVPPLDVTSLNRSILVTFKEGPLAIRSGCKAKVIDICLGHSVREESYIVVEAGEVIKECDLRKYPRFNPGLFGQIQISFGETVLEIEDISVGGVRGICQEGNLQHLTKGAMIRLTVAIEEQNHHVDAQVMRIRPVIGEKEHWELAVAFMQWDRLTNVL